MDQSRNESLTVRRAGIVRRVDALFRAMSSDFLLREQFVTDPAEILSEYVYGRKLSPEETVPINHLIYSVMSNRKLVQWVRDRAFQSQGGAQSRGSFASDFSEALMEHGNNKMVDSLNRSSAPNSQGISFDEELLSDILRTVTGFASGTEQSTGGGGGTQQSGTHTTEHSTGGGGTRGWLRSGGVEESNSILLQAGDGTEHSPGGGGTQQSGTHTTEHSTGGGGTRGWIETVGIDLSDNVLLRAGDGTEHSPGGGGTQQSGTHTTEHSTGGGGTRGWLEFFGNNYAAVTLEALSKYSANLQKLGLLDKDVR